LKILLKSGINQFNKAGFFKFENGNRLTLFDTLWHRLVFLTTSSFRNIQYEKVDFLKHFFVQSFDFICPPLVTFKTF